MMTLREIKDKLKAKWYMSPVVWLWRCLYSAIWRIEKCIRYVNGRCFMKELAASKKDNEMYFVMYPSMGDTLYGLSVLSAIHEKYPDKKLVVVGYEKFYAVLYSFSDIDRIVLIDTINLRRMYNFLAFNRLAKIGLTKCVINMHVFRYYKLYFNNPANNDWDAMAVYRKIFSLRDDSPVIYHGLKKVAVKSIKNFASIKDRAVMINSYSSSMRTTMEIYEPLCDELKRRGYIVFSNVVGEQKPVRGSTPLKCSFEEVYSIACDIPLVVSVRSGLLDLLIPSGVSMFVIYDHASYFMKNAYKLDAWNSSCKVQEVIVDTDDDMKAIPEKFSSFIDELKAEGRIS